MFVDAVAAGVRPASNATPRLQWRHRVGISPTSRRRRANVGCLAQYSSHALFRRDPDMTRSAQQMTKRSTLTTRDQPIREVSAISGSLVVRAELLTIETTEQLQILDLTERIMSLVQQVGVHEGIVNVFSLHTTCTLFINEFQRALISDIRSFLDRIVDPDHVWLHNDPAHSDCDRMNAAAHLRAMMLGHSATMQISSGEVVLGQWQRILLAELDGPRTRTVRVQVMGTA